MACNFFPTLRLLTLFAALILTANAKSFASDAANPGPSLAELKKKWGSVPLNKITQAAEGGDLTAEHYLGYCYASGERLATNGAEAVVWYERAIKGGYLPSANNLGLLYAKGEVVPRDLTRAVYYTRLAADKNFPQAQVNLGFFYHNGTGVSQDDEQAFKLFMQAAERGYPEAMFQVYLGYQNGSGVAEDDHEAEKWLAKAAEAGHPYAQCLMGYNYEFMDWDRYHEISHSNDMPMAILWYRRSADQNWPGGQYRLGLCYLIGKGVDWDEEQGLELIRKAADKNHTYSLVKLAELYAAGIGEPRDNTDRPANLLIRAANMDFEKAIDELIDRYQSGLGIGRDLVKAAQWYCRAADEQLPRYRLDDKMYASGNEDSAADPFFLARALYLEATKRGDASAMTSIGDMYVQGRNVPQDSVEAWAWFSLALGQGDSSASSKLVQLESKMTAQQIGSAKQRLGELTQRVQKIP